MSDKENDQNNGDHKEKNLKRHELSCLRFSDGTASDRDVATLKRKGIELYFEALIPLSKNNF